nr:HAD-IA family hydrolase [Actinoplanes auranticolor]
MARLHADGVPMAVVSDSWPDLDDLFRRLGLRDYFVTLVISAVLGCRKPDPRMYRAGSDALGLAPADCLFVDDDPDLVGAAIRLGYQGVTLVREPGAEPPAATPWITSLRELSQ